jgi:hypothetical protein
LFRTAPRPVYTRTTKRSAVFIIQPHSRFPISRSIVTEGLTAHPHTAVDPHESNERLSGFRIIVVLGVPLRPPSLPQIDMVKADLTRDYYADLELQSGASESDIKKQFRALGMRSIPL